MGVIALAVMTPLNYSRVSAQTQTNTVLLSPIDTYINLNTENYVTAATLATYTWPNNQAANAILMKFDLTQLPAGATVQSARIRMNLVEADAKNTTTYTISAHKIIGRNPDLRAATGTMATASAQWAASSCCYNGIPLAQGNISPAYTSTAVNKTLGTKWWTITNLVQEWIGDPTTNYGVLLNADTNVLKDRYRYFASMEYPDASLRPALEVTYTASDATPPTVSITSPTNGAVVGGAVAVTASAQDASGIAGVQFRLNGAVMGAEVTSSPYTYNWNTSTLTDGTYSLTAVARDTQGNLATSAAVGVNVRNAVSGTTTITIVPTDTSLSLDTSNKSTEPILTTYTWPENQIANAILMKFDLSQLPAGASIQDATLSMSLVESDATTDPTYTITAHKVITRNPVINAATGYSYNGTGNWDPSTCCYSSIPLGQGDITTAYDSKAIDKTAGVKTWSLTRMVQEWQSSPGSNFGVILNSDPTKGKDRYRFFASTENTNSGLRPFLRITLSGGTTSGSGSTGGTTPTPDTTAPTVSMTSPAAGATVSGTTVSVGANATDNIGVAGVQFKLDGNNLGGEDLTAPYATSWNTTSTANGTHTLTAVARDAAGNQRTSASLTVTVSNTTTTPPPPSGGLSALYPGDAGIESNPNVIFTEQFEEGSIANVVPRWGDVKNQSNMRLVTDVPPGSPAGHALSIPWEGGGVSDGGHLYKVLSPGVDDVIYIRYYIKYPTDGVTHHSGIWTGGFNPVSAWPDPCAGCLPSGTDRFMAVGEHNNITNAFEHYDYWMGMHPDAGGAYWGNFLLNNPAVQLPRGQWACVEQMVKLNNPTSSYNGEHALWINGTKVSHLGQGFPHGHWEGGRFYQVPTDPGTFEGFRWRSTTALNVNFIWLQNYSPDDPAGFSSTILYDHVVVAKSYIGCM